MALIDLLEM
ncbi:unnamed protein product, partial [Rotaria magnacalcarata]